MIGRFLEVLMEGREKFYICPVCFRTCDTEIECHDHRMVECEAGIPGDERRRPVADRFGNYVSRAPRWYMEAVGWIHVE